MDNSMTVVKFYKHDNYKDQLSFNVTNFLSKDGIASVQCYESLKTFIDKNKIINRKVGVKIQNNIECLISLLILLKNNNQVYILNKCNTHYEEMRLCDEHSVCVILRQNNAANLYIENISNDTNEGKINVACICLSTSGTTGQPKLIKRTVDSFIDEGYRYIDALKLTTEDHILIPLPISHAYSLGWVFAAILSSARLEITGPEHFSQITDSITSRASIIVLTNEIAKLLTLRVRQTKTKITNRLRIAMVGAGMISQRLADEFSDVFSIGLSGNYGSTETGTLFYQMPPMNLSSIGIPFPSVKFELRSERGGLCENDEIGRLFVKVQNYLEYDTADLAYIDSNNNIIFSGRASNSMRRYGRWISPVEIESVILSVSGIEDVNVYYDSEKDVICATVVAKKGMDSIYLKDFLKGKLSRYKIPDMIDFVSEIPRNFLGKIENPTGKLFLNSMEYYSNILQQYKLSSFLMALIDSKLLGYVQMGCSLDLMSEKTGIPKDRLEQILSIAEQLGLLVGQMVTGRTDLDLLEKYSDLEQVLAKKYNSIENLQHVITNKTYEPSSASIDLRLKYQDALHGQQHNYRILYAMKKIGKLQQKNILEITVSNGTYINCIKRLYKDNTFFLYQPENAIINACFDAGSHDIEIFNSISDISDNSIDIFIINNSIHYLSGLSQLILKAAKQGAFIIIDDIFSDDSSNAVMLIDWLSHGGQNYLTSKTLINELNEIGFRSTRIDDRKSFYQSLFLFHHEEYI